MLVSDGQIMWGPVIVFYVIALVVNLALFAAFASMLRNLDWLDSDTVYETVARIALALIILLPGSYVVVWAIIIIVGVIVLVGVGIMNFIINGEF